MPVDWRQFHVDQEKTTPVVEPRRRLRICLIGFLVGLLVVYARVVQLEVTQGDAFRTVALRPIEKNSVLPAPRGRILARDGTPLAYDRTIRSVAVDYRWLEDPPDPRWLRAKIRARLAKPDRGNPEKLAMARAAVLVDRTELARRLARLCGLSKSQWTARTQQIQARVERIAAGVNRRRHSTDAADQDADASWTTRLRRLLLEDPPPPRITVAEELAHHVVADDVPEDVISEINDHPDRYPRTKIIEFSRRTYPRGALAAHVLGHLGEVDVEELTACSGRDCPPRKPYLPGDLVGRMGVERQYETVLRGRPGTAVERTDRSGHVLASFHSQEPLPGNNIRLTLDTRLQQTAEELLQSALQRKRGQNYLSRKNSSDPFYSGGAIIVMDVRDGAIRAAASAPAFDPNQFIRGDTAQITALLADKAHPLFNRVCRMAIPPGSTFKTVTAAALLESADLDPEESFFCQGYLHQPDHQRCEIYTRQGVGHGRLTLADALAVSCNVYFFHFTGLMGPRPLVDWAERFGFSRPTGIDLPGEAAGLLPSPENIAQFEGRAWRTVDTQSMAIGQGLLTATPLQVSGMMAAVANGGRLVRPHVLEQIVRGQGPGTRDQEAEDDPRSTIHYPLLSSRPFLSPRTLQVLREGLRRVVANPRGTAHGTVYLESIAIAGKTGTAETGEDQAAHAWFVGYAPADDPKLALVVVLEHAGDAATAAGPLAKRLVLRMEQLGML